MTQTLSRTPVHLLTGFLGSGKTSILRQWLTDPAMAETAVIINELGEIGLDHLLVREVKEDVLLLASGCVCCSVREDLLSTLTDLKAQVQAGELPPFQRVVVETTGLADPLPIMQAIVSLPQINSHYQLGQVICTVDGINGSQTLKTQAEARQQAAVADALLITKLDVIDAAQRAQIEYALRLTNTHAPLLSAKDTTEWFDRPREQAFTKRSFQSNGKIMSSTLHDSDIHSFVVEWHKPLTWSVFMEWMELLLYARGDTVLRVKGLVMIDGQSGPTVVQGVQHVLFPFEQLSAWPKEHGQCSRLVFIGKNLLPQAVLRSLETLTGANI